MAVNLTCRTSGRSGGALNERRCTMKVRIAFLSVLAFASIMALYTLYSTFIIVPAGYLGVLLNWGAVSDTVFSEGIHFVIPYKQDVIKMNVQVQKVVKKAEASSADLQSVQAAIALNFHARKTEVNKLYQEVGQKYIEVIIDPAIQESVKAVTAQYTAEDLIKKREQVRDGVKKLIDRKSCLKGRSFQKRSTKLNYRVSYLRRCRYRIFKMH